MLLICECKELPNSFKSLQRFLEAYLVELSKTDPSFALKTTVTMSPEWYTAFCKEAFLEKTGLQSATNSLGVYGFFVQAIMTPVGQFRIKRDHTQLEDFKVD